MDALAVLTASLKATGKPSSPGYHYDMMHDLERNEAYAVAIAAEAEEDDFILDIGAGSGLLSLLASRSAAQHVFACEADPALAETAAAVVAANGLEARVHVLRKPSTSLSVGFGKGCDLPCKADLVVTEIFDSVLLGEGVLATLRDAHGRLLAPGGRVVPHAGTIMGVLLASATAEGMFGLQQDGPLGAGATAGRPAAQATCSVAPIHMHLDPLVEHGLAVPLSAPFAALRCGFAERPPEPAGSTTVAVTATADGEVNCVGVWFELQMDRAGAVRLGTAPRFADAAEQPPSTPRPPARDHWRQAVCLLPTPRRVTRGETITLLVCHDDLTPAFAVQEEARPVVGPASAPPDASPTPARVPSGLGGAHDHAAVPWQRLLQLNDPVHARVHAAWLCELPPHCELVLAVGDSLTIPAAWASAAPPSVSLVCCCSDGAHSRARAWLGAAGVPAARLAALGWLAGTVGSAAGVHAAGLQHPAELAAALDDPSAVVAVVAEPFYDVLLGREGASQTWALDHILHLRQQLSALRVRGVLSTARCELVPAGATEYSVRAVAVECDELWRRRQPVGQAVGFELGAFNEHAPRPEAGGQLVLLDATPWRGVLRELSAAVTVATLDVSAAFSAAGVGGLAAAGAGAAGAGGVEAGAGGPELHAAPLRLTHGGTCHAVLLWTEVAVQVAGADATERACDSYHRHACVLLPAPVAVRPGEELRVEMTVEGLECSRSPAGPDARDALRGCRVAWSVGPSGRGAGAGDAPPT